MNPVRSWKSKWPWVMASTLLGLGTVLITILSLTSYYAWSFPLELLTHFQLQYFVVTLILAGFLSAIARPPWIYTVLFCLALQLTQLLPWYIETAKPSASELYPLRILSANVNVQNRSYQATVQWVQTEQPDVAIFIEVDEAWAQGLQPLEAMLPYQIQHPNPYNWGIFIYSRYPLSDPALETWGTEQSPSVIATVEMPNHPVRLVAAHPPPPIRAELLAVRDRQLDGIGKYIQAQQAQNLPFVVAGDLNITPWSPNYRRFERRAGLVNTRRGFGLLPTWPQDAVYPQTGSALFALMQIPIDHCLVGAGIGITAMHTGVPIGSDHLPIVADLLIPLPSAVSNAAQEISRFH